METAANTSSIDSKILLLISLFQGLVLLLLHESMEFQFWPHQQPQWLFAFYAIAVAVPVMLLLGLTDNWQLICRWLAIYAVLIFCVGYYMGGQALPVEHISPQTLLFPFIATLTIATFKTLMYAQHFASGGPLSYSTLFVLSWRNFLTLGLSVLFAACTWGLLMLWAGLFKAIKIHVFYDLFTERWFYYPVLALAHGFGVIIFRAQSGVIDTITRIQQALMKFLLIILAVVSLMFLLALPFSGLEPLWETGGSHLILWMQALMLFFVNAVYQDDPKTQPYHRWAHRLIYFAVALLPIYSAISFYGLSLRVEQYGWSVARCWAFLLWFVFAGFSISYFWGILRFKDLWLQQLSWVNVRMGLVVLCLMLLVNSPILDFRKITTNSQMARLDNALVSLDDFDYRYFHRNLAAPGFRALQEIKRDNRHEHPKVALRIESFYIQAQNQDSSISRSDFLRSIEGADDAPPSLIEELYDDISSNRWRIQDIQGYQLMATDLNSDGVKEYVLVEVLPSHISFTLYHQRSQDWERRALRRVGNQESSYRAGRNDLLDALEQKDYKSIESPWKSLKVGDQVFQVE